MKFVAEVSVSSRHSSELFPPDDVTDVVDKAYSTAHTSSTRKGSSKLSWGRYNFRSARGAKSGGQAGRRNVKSTALHAEIGNEPAEMHSLVSERMMRSLGSIKAFLWRGSGRGMTSGHMQFPFPGLRED